MVRAFGKARMTSVLSASPVSSGSLFSSGLTSGWMADAITAEQSAANPAGIMGALQNIGDGSVNSYIQQSTNIANNFALISQNSVTNASSLYAQIAAQNQQDQAQQKLQTALDALSRQQQMVQAKNVLDPVIYLSDGTTIDTNSNIMTMPDGTQYDTTTGAKYTDPASIIEMANGAYLNTSTNIMTLGDGTQIDTVTGLKVSTTA
jgi:sensor c-di-GMP phosphodiesterase-like protein